MSYNLAELAEIKGEQAIALGKTRGYTAAWYSKQMFQNGDPKRFKQILEDELMNDYEKVIENQTNTIKILMGNWGDSFKKLKADTEENKKYIRKNTGEIKDSVERLRQGIDKFITVIDVDKFRHIAESITIIADGLSKINELEETGALKKLANILTK